MNGLFKLSNKKLTVAIAVSVAAVLIITVSVLTLALSMSDADEPTKLPLDDENAGDDKDQITDGKNDKNDKDNAGNTQKPDGDKDNTGGSEDPDDDTGANKGDGDTETVLPVPDTPKWSSPVEGYVFKQHSTDALVYSLTLGDYRTHRGIDISASAGSEVKACLDGKIENVYYDHMMGHCVSIVHNDGMVSYYKNLGQELPEGIAEGKTVSSGEIIGYVGESAMVEFSDEPHLHFELEVSGNAIDPLEFLNYSDRPSDIENE